MAHQIAVVVILLTFSEVLSTNLPNCPKIYQRFSTSHSYCQPRNPSCNILQSGVSQNDRNKILEIHNHYRSVIATQGPKSNGLPSASDMMYMEWDNELAAVAQKRAEQCIYEHDTASQRRVRNFGVGQNIGQYNVTGATQAPKPDWAAALGGFYDEIKYFSRDMICGNRHTPPDQIIGHFTQLVWSRTFRVGCGYVLYKVKDTFVRLYFCNYGPGGNIDSSCVYKEGPACSKCPINTQCGADPKYPGLCKRINDEAPYVPVTEPSTIFSCNFNNPSSPDCQISPSGDGQWGYVPALGGQFVETVLQPGQKSTLTFTKQLVGSGDPKLMCVQIRYRKGPNLAKDPENNQGKLVLVVPSFNDYTYAIDFKSLTGDARQTFSKSDRKMKWNAPTNMKITFEVPKGATPQFFNIITVVGFNQQCKDDVEY